MYSKINKLKRFWSYYLDTCISKGAQEELARINHNYESHRAKSAQKNQDEMPEQKITVWRALRRMHSHYKNPTKE